MGFIPGMAALQEMVVITLMSCMQATSSTDSWTKGSCINSMGFGLAQDTAVVVMATDVLADPVEALPFSRSGHSAFQCPFLLQLTQAFFVVMTSWDLD